jgi:hypothetical protein
MLPQLAGLGLWPLGAPATAGRASVTAPACVLSVLACCCAVQSWRGPWAGAPSLANCCLWPVTTVKGLSSGSASWSLSRVSVRPVFASSGESVGKVSCGTRCPVARVATCCAVSVVGSGKSPVVSMGPGAVARACLGDAGPASGPGQSSFIPMVSVMVGSAGATVPRGTVGGGLFQGLPFSAGRTGPFGALLLLLQRRTGRLFRSRWGASFGELLAGRVGVGQRPRGSCLALGSCLV